MRNILMVILSCIFFATGGNAQTDGKILWAFPITDYITPLNDSIKVVQVVLPPQVHFELDKQFGLLRGISRDALVDTGTKGYGRCHLIKGVYNYFSILLQQDKTPQEGDVVYTFIPKIAGNYESPLYHCASHNITFLNVEDTAFYKTGDFLKKRTKLQDDALVKKMVADIQRTGKYYLAQDSSMNKLIEGGDYKDKRILDVMAVAKDTDVTAFLKYVAARPRRYAGNHWKVSETFATWLMNDAPTVIE